ncbi:MAG: hypothetical protein KBF08_04380, partial [Kiritimatiellae bacterium]|nr:hypothetical protein [Kiritimatiellia bacterium]
MKTSRLVGHVAGMVLLAALAAGVASGQPEITAFNGNGQISWVDPGGTGTHYAVQWSTSGLSNWMSWQDAEATLAGLGPTGSAAVPMFYRVVAQDPTYKPTESYTYFQKLPLFDPLTPLATNEMRITFMGSMIPLPVR